MTQSDSEVRVRFAPSPTGYLHIGGARTALFNWLFARHTDGKFLLRIEDTDLERSTEESTQQILESMSWLGMTPDEEVEYQTRRADRHKEYMRKLLESGAAYKCYCSKERLEELREKAKAEGRTAAYDKKCLLDKQWVAQHEAENAPFVVRFAVNESGSTAFDDLVYGRIEVENRQIGDFVIARPDGSPVYNFTNAVDDIDMRITHICRGEDHISNTSRQVLIYQALAASPPRFAHLPLILGPDKTRLSKRHGATSVMQFLEQGIRPEALINFIALLGWAPEGGSEEVMSQDELIRKFSLDKVNKSPAVFDYEKLLWMNGVYIRSMAPDQIYEEVIPKLQFKYGEAAQSYPDESLRAIIDLLVERSRSMNDFVLDTEYFFVRPQAFEEKGVRKFLSSPEQVKILQDAGTEMDNAWEKLLPEPGRAAFGESLEHTMRQFAESRGVKLGNVMQPLRLALTGKTASPGLFDIARILGKDEVRERITAAVSRFSMQQGG
jgi:glutamyl-tRNA synthetase